MKSAKIETIKIKSKRTDQNEKGKNDNTLNSSNKQISKNDGFQSKLFNNEESDLNRSKSSIKSGATSKNNFELKSKIFSDSSDNRKSGSILNISPIKKDASMENISKTEFKAQSPNLMQDTKNFEDSKFNDIDR